uniref:Zinc finger protein Rlf/292/654 TPR repeats domain-containing protein n=1 Tax=Ciona savignyi TaxID=51511 RepID=H2YBC1_CIOSA
SRTTCVEVLVHALHVLAPDDPNNELLKSGILSSIAYFLPNSQIARSCSLTIFFSDPSRDHYFELSNMYKVEYDRDNDPSLNCKAQLRLQLLDYLHQQWPPEFASCE